MKKDKLLLRYNAQAVQFFLKEKKYTYSDIANVLQVSEQFIKNIHSFNSDKHYNNLHLWKISLFLGIDISNFYPTNYELYKKIVPYGNIKEFKKMRYEDNE